MPPRSQPDRLEHPLNADQVEAIDQMFQILFDDIGNDSIFPTTTEGDTMYQDATRVVRLGIGLPNTVLRTDGIIPEWGKVDLATGGETTGTLPVSSGGTNSTSFTAGSIIFAGAGGTTLTQDNANLFWDDARDILGIGTTDIPATGTEAIIFGDGIGLAGMGSNTAGVYADDVAGTVQLFAINEAGVATQLTGLGATGVTMAQVMQRVVLGI